MSQLSRQTRYQGKMWPTMHQDPNVFRRPGGIEYSERKYDKLTHTRIAEDLAPHDHVSWRRARIYDAMKLKGLGLRHRRQNMFALRGPVRQMEARIAGPGKIPVKAYRTRSGKSVKSYTRSR